MDRNIKTVTLFIVIFVILLIFILCYVKEIRTKKLVRYDAPDIYNMNSKIMSENKKYCNTEITYCFKDSECAVMCDRKTRYVCLNGVCRNDKILNASTPENKCDIRKGLIGYLVGDVAYGKYNFICKSVDPGIALTTDNNLMCKGQKDIIIDYTMKFPTINNCLCTNQSIVPATKMKRKHIECDNIYYELVARGL